ncbi:transposase [Nonomuraea angiospora]|uniref:transposase n=1 Tax=Nonomuraea angiospora TaxID=46172 RepID=UPI0034498AB9
MVADRSMDPDGHLQRTGGPGSPVGSAASNHVVSHRQPSRSTGAAAVAAHRPAGEAEVVRAVVAAELGSGGVLIVDETRSIKKGDGSVGVQRRYNGAAGRIENWHIGVFLGLRHPTRQGAAGSAALPAPAQAGWADPDRSQAGRRPARDRLRTKPALAAAMVPPALGAGVPASCRLAGFCAGLSGRGRTRR